MITLNKSCKHCLEAYKLGRKDREKEIIKKIENLHGIGITLDGKHFTDSVSRNDILDLLTHSKGKGGRNEKK